MQKTVHVDMDWTIPLGQLSGLVSLAGVSFEVRQSPVEALQFLKLGRILTTTSSHLLDYWSDITELVD